ncbi:hypothetical protein Tco_0931627 [Tanacetum coccineum]
MLAEERAANLNTQPPQETSVEILQDRENIINSVQIFLRKFNRYSFFETPKVLLLAWDKVFEIKDAIGNKHYKPEGILELFHKLHDDVQNIHEELAEYINTPNWNRPIVYYDDDDDEDYTIAITPVLSTEEPITSKVFPTKMCDVPCRDNSPPLDILKDQFEGFSDSNDDSTSIDEDSFSIDDIDYVEASPPDSEPFFFSFTLQLSALNRGDGFFTRKMERLRTIFFFCSFIFDLSINPFPLAGRSDFYHEEFADELAHIISPTREYGLFLPLSMSPSWGDFIWMRDCPDSEASRARGFCPSITRASYPQLHFGNPIS